MQYIPPYSPLLYRENWGVQGFTYFLIFAPKHRLWVLVRTASPSKNKKNILKKILLFLPKIFNFYNIRKICILHEDVFVMLGKVSNVDSKH